MTDEANTHEIPTSVECSAAKDPAVRLFILAAMMVGIGVWCLIDMHNYPYKSISEDLNGFFTYVFNHYSPIVLLPLGLLAGLKAVMGLRRRLVADGEGIGYVGRQKISWSAVKSLDSAKLASKGILNITYDAGEGERTLVLDSWKLQNFRDLVRLVESKVAPPPASQ
jgi:hypothetical protein